MGAGGRLDHRKPRVVLACCELCGRRSSKARSSRYLCGADVFIYSPWRRRRAAHGCPPHAIDDVAVLYIHIFYHRLPVQLHQRADPARRASPRKKARDMQGAVLDSERVRSKLPALAHLYCEVQVVGMDVDSADSF